MNELLPPLVTPEELSRALGISRSTISRMIASGQRIAGLETIWLTPTLYRWRRTDVEIVVCGHSTTADKAA